MDFFNTTGEDDDGQVYLDVPEIPEEEAVEAFSNLPLIQRATALLQWVGKGKPVTATGALRLRDIAAAAACVGVAVKGGTKQEDSPLSATAGSADEVPTVRSMYEVPQLALLWSALEATELIELKPTRLCPPQIPAPFSLANPHSGSRSWCSSLTSSWWPRCSIGIQNSRGKG